MCPLAFPVCAVSLALGCSQAHGAVPPLIADYFQDAPLTRWSVATGTWRVTETIELHDLDCRDIYFSPEEPSHLAWVGLWKENDGAIKASFAQITGSPGLEPSYAPWYGSGRALEDWVAFTKQHRMRVGPWEEANKTTRVECPTLVTRDNGQTWEDLGTDQQPRGANLRVVQLKDGSHLMHGVSLIRCRDGRLVSTAVFAGDASGDDNPKPGDLIAVSESLDGGKTWSKMQHIRPPDDSIIKPDQTYEENGLVELADGRILAVIRTDPGSPCQTYLTRTGPGQYTATPPTWTPMGNTGLPEVAGGSDGVIWYWGLDGHWYTVDEGKTWQAAPVRFTSYYGKMVEAAPGLILSVTQNQIQDSPYPWSHDASVEMVRFAYRRLGVLEQADATAPAVLLRRTGEGLADLHLRAEVRLDGATGLAFRVSPDEAFCYVFAVIMPGTPVYQKWFPPEVQAPVLSANYTPEDTRTVAAGYAMAVIARMDAGKLHVLRGTRLTGVKRGDWVQLQVKAKGDLIQGAVNSELGLPQRGLSGGDTNRDTGPAYVGARDATYDSGGVGLLTDMSTGAFSSFCVWPAPQMMRDLWTHSATVRPTGPRASAPRQADGFIWAYDYEGDVIPPVSDPSWDDMYRGENIGTADDGVLTLRSTLEQQERFEISDSKWWTARPEVGTTVECRVRVVRGVAPDKPATLLRFGNGAYALSLYLFPDKIDVGQAHALDTTDRFHTYRMTLVGNEAKVYLDGDPQPVISTTANPDPSNAIFFGDASNSYVGGENQWDYIRWTNAGSHPPAGQP